MSTVRDTLLEDAKTFGTRKVDESAPQLPVSANVYPDPHTCPDLTAEAIKLRLIYQGVQLGSESCAPLHNYLCVDRRSACYGTNLYIPVTDATPDQLRKTYAETERRFQDRQSPSLASSTLAA